MRDRVLTITHIVVAVCFALIVVAMAFDWATKYYIYLNQRDYLYSLINGSEEYESVKSIVSYLQGTATRQLNKLKDVTIIFGLVFASFSFYIKLIKKG